MTRDFKYPKEVKRGEIERRLHCQEKQAPKQEQPKRDQKKA